MKTPTRKVTTVIVDSEACAIIVRSRREAQEMSLRELARQMGLSAAYVSDLELGRRPWSTKLFQTALAMIRRHKPTK